MDQRLRKEKLQMTPKEKAKDLYDKFDFGYSEAKDSALIAVKEIIKIFDDTNGNDFRLEFWKNVKKEIEKL